MSDYCNIEILSRAFFYLWYFFEQAVRASCGSSEAQGGAPGKICCLITGVHKQCTVYIYRLIYTVKRYSINFNKEDFDLRAVENLSNFDVFRVAKLSTL